MKKRPKPIYVVYVGGRSNRFRHQGRLFRAEGAYTFNAGLATEIGGVAVDEMGRVIPEILAGKGAVWATDNIDWFTAQAEINPQVWAVFRGKPSARDIAAIPAPVEDEPVPTDGKDEGDG